MFLFILFLFFSYFSQCFSSITSLLSSPPPAFLISSLTSSAFGVWKSWYCHAYDWLYTGFGLVNVEHLCTQLVITKRYCYFTLCNSLHYCAHVSLLSLLCLHQSLPGVGVQQCSLLPCSRFYQLSTVSQLTSQQGRHRRHRSSAAVSIVAFAFVRIPTWSLLSHRLETTVIYRVIT
jgi:hypothetical protein